MSSKKGSDSDDEAYNRKQSLKDAKTTVNDEPSQPKSEINSKVMVDHKGNPIPGE